MPEQRNVESFVDALVERLEERDRRSLESRVTALESSSATKDEVSKQETALIKWIVGVGISTIGVGAAVAAGMASLMIQILGD